MGGPQDVEWAIDARPARGRKPRRAAKPAGNGLEPEANRPGPKKTYATGIAGVLGTLLAPVQASVEKS